MISKKKRTFIFSLLVVLLFLVTMSLVYAPCDGVTILGEDKACGAGDLICPDEYTLNWFGCPYTDSEGATDYGCNKVRDPDCCENGNLNYLEDCEGNGVCAPADCNFVTRTYAPQESCSTCDCSPTYSPPDDTAYCNNCNNCNDGVLNCGEVCQGNGQCRAEQCGDPTLMEYAAPVSCSNCQCAASILLPDEASYCANCNPAADGVVNCGESCIQGNECRPTYCDYNNQQYADAITCQAGGICPAYSYDNTEIVYCPNCPNHCTDGVDNCGEQCQPADTQCLSGQDQICSACSWAQDPTAVDTDGDGYDDDCDIYVNDPCTTGIVLGDNCGTPECDEEGEGTYCSNCNHCGDGTVSCGETCDGTTRCDSGQDQICSGTCNWIQNPAATDFDGDGADDACDTFQLDPCSIDVVGDNCGTPECDAEGEGTYCTNCNHCADAVDNCAEVCQTGDECAPEDCDIAQRAYAPPVDCNGVCGCSAYTYSPPDDTAYCVNCNPDHFLDGSLNCGENCTDGNECRAEQCDLAQQKYALAVDCSGGACPPSVFGAQHSVEYCNNCNHAADGVTNCGEGCTDGDPCPATCDTLTQRYAPSSICAGGACPPPVYGAPNEQAYCDNCGNCGDTVVNCLEECELGDIQCDIGQDQICSACSWAQDPTAVDTDGDGYDDDCDIYVNDPCSHLLEGDNCGSPECDAEGEGSYCTNCNHCADGSDNCAEICQPGDAQCVAGDYQTCSSCAWLPNQGTDSDGDGYDWQCEPTGVLNCDNEDDIWLNPQPAFEGVTETICDDVIDNDCDTTIDCDDLLDCNGRTCAPGSTCQLGICTPVVGCNDNDNDGYGLNGGGACTFPGLIDCDDDTAGDPGGCPGNPALCDASRSDCAICINPGAITEVCDDGVDNDCKNGFDCQEASCTGQTNNAGNICCMQNMDCSVAEKCVSNECIDAKDGEKASCCLDYVECYAVLNDPRGQTCFQNLCEVLDEHPNPCPIGTDDIFKDPNRDFYSEYQECPCTPHAVYSLRDSCLTAQDIIDPQCEQLVIDVRGALETT